MAETRIKKEKRNHEAERKKPLIGQLLFRFQFLFAKADHGDISAKLCQRRIEIRNATVLFPRNTDAQTESGETVAWVYVTQFI